MQTVVVGLSGGVDSSVAAYLLKQQGFKVIGLHMRGENELTQAEDEQRVKALCQKLGIECVVVDYKNHMQKVKDYFISEYLSGRTPNPCVICNKEVKFNPFIEYMQELGADYFATGHYAIVEHKGDKHFLKQAIDESKDQSYFLCQLSQQQIAKVLFPLGNLSKAEVKQIAQENGLVDSSTKESYDICFLGSQKFKDYMQTNHPEKSGNIIDVTTNKVVGTHTGISKYTIGQRKGLNIGGKNGFSADRWFVVKKDTLKNILYVSCGECEEMYSTACIVTNFNFITKPSNKFSCNAKVRYHQKNLQVEVEEVEPTVVKLTFKEKQKAVTLGQFAVLYTDDGYCLGGGIINEIIM